MKIYPKYQMDYWCCADTSENFMNLFYSKGEIDEMLDDKENILKYYAEQTFPDYAIAKIDVVAENGNENLVEVNTMNVQLRHQNEEDYRKSANLNLFDDTILLQATNLMYNDEKVLTESDLSGVTDVAEDLAEFKNEQHSKEEVIASALTELHNSISELEEDASTKEEVIASGLNENHTAITNHTADTTIHVTASEKSTWNNKPDVWLGTQTEYDELINYDNNTIYLIYSE